MGHVWSCHVMVMCSAVWSTLEWLCTMVHVPDSDICKAINAKIYDSSSSSSDDTRFVVTKHPLQLGKIYNFFLRIGNLHLLNLVTLYFFH